MNFGRVMTLGSALGDLTSPTRIQMLGEVESQRMTIAHILMRRRSYSNNAELQGQLAALVARITERDEASLERFREITVAILLAQIRTHFNAGVDEQEVLNEVYLQVWCNSARYDAGRGAVITWLAVICAARVIDHFRKSEHRARGADLCRAAVTPCAVEPSPEDVLLAAESAMTIKAAVDGLSPLRKRLVTMAFFQELSHAEIAQQTHIALGTIKSHIRRALMGMRAKMTVEETLRPTRDKANRRERSEVPVARRSIRP